MELYRNGELLGYQNRTNDGYFEFADIPLLLGKNKFKLIFYGPQGQTKEKEEIIFFNGNILNRGKGRLRLNYINKNRHLIETRDFIRSTSRGHNAFAEAGYGLTDFLTANVSAMADSLELYYDWPPQAAYRKDKKYVAGNLSLFAYGIFSSIGTVVDLDKSVATLDYYGQTTLFDWDITFEHIHYGRAVLARNLYNNTTMENETTLRVNKVLTLFDKLSLPFSYSLRHFELLNNAGSQTEHIVSLSQTLPYNIYLNAQYQNYDYVNDMRNEQLMLTANRVRGPWTLRGSTTYNLTYNRMYNTEFSAYRSLGPRMKVGARYAYQSRSLAEHNYESLYSANLSYLTKYGYISMEAGTSNKHNSYAFIGYNVSFVPDMLHHRFYTTGSKVQGTGALSSFAFMDANGNGTFDAKEPLLPAADFTTKPRVNVYDSYKHTPTGDTMLTHLSAYRDFDVDVDISNVDDTLSLLNTSGTRTVKLRPAQVMYLSFPIVGTGDIEGTVYKQDASGKRTPFRGAVVNLYKGGKLIASKVSEFDGYYSFPQVPLGTYLIWLDATQAHELDLRQQKLIVVNLKEMEQFEVRDMVLIKHVSKRGKPANRQIPSLAVEEETPVTQSQIATLHEELPPSVVEEILRTEAQAQPLDEELPPSVIEEILRLESLEQSDQEELPPSVMEEILRLEAQAGKKSSWLDKMIRKAQAFRSHLRAYKQYSSQKK